jgi:hypothetical protein
MARPPRRIAVVALILAALVPAEAHAAPCTVTLVRAAGQAFLGSPCCARCRPQRRLLRPPLRRNAPRRRRGARFEGTGTARRSRARFRPRPL